MSYREQLEELQKCTQLAQEKYKKVLAKIEERRIDNIPSGQLYEERDAAYAEFGECIKKYNDLIRYLTINSIPLESEIAEQMLP